MKCPKCENKLNRQIKITIQCQACGTNLKLKASKYKNPIVGAILGALGYWIYSYQVYAVSLIVIISLIAVLIIVSMLMIEYAEINS